MSEKSKAGRPPKHSDPEELQKLINKYEKNCIAREAPMTFSGLAYALGFCYRSEINEYAKKEGPISLPIKRAMLRIEQDYEERLSKPNCTGSIFALKNRGWSDKQEIDMTANVSGTALLSPEIKEMLNDYRQERTVKPDN